MPLLRRRKHKERRSKAKMRLGWRQRARIVGVPQSARDLLEQLESRGTSEPGYVAHVADIVRELEDEPAMLTFGLFHTPGHTVIGVVVVVGEVGLVLIDAKDGHPYAEFRWPTLCRFDVKHDGSYQIVGLAWYGGERDITERLSAIQEAFDAAAIPKKVHQRPPLV